MRIGIVITGLTVTTLVLCFNRVSIAQGIEPTTVGVSSISSRDWSLRQTHVQGAARPASSAELRPLVAGIIAEVHVSEGQRVAAGDVLVTLDDRLEQAKRRIADLEANRKAELARAASQLAQAERQLSRLRSALERKAISEFELEEQLAVVEQARAARDAQLEALQLAESRRLLVDEELRRLRICAPFDGVITQVHQKIGTSVDPTVPVISVVNLESLEIELFAPVTQFGELKVGHSVELVALEPVNRTLTAQVISVSPVIDSASATFRCLLHVQNDDLALPAGFSVLMATASPGK